VSLPPLDTQWVRYCLLVNSQLTSVLTSQQNKAANERREILTRTCRRPRSHTVRLWSTPDTTPAPSHLSTPRNSSPPTNTSPGVADASASTTGRERRIRKSINYAETEAQHVRIQSIIPCSHPTHSHRNMRKPDSVPTQLKRTSSSSGSSQDDDKPMVSERRRKSRPLRLPVDDDEESDGARADEEPLAGSRARTTGLVNVDMRRRSGDMSASRRSLIEDDEGRRHSMFV
jgi:hypothetical protein